MAKSRPESVFARPRWSEGDAREVMTALARSGKSVSAFAEEHGLDPQRVYLWRRRFGVSAEATTFQEVLVQPSQRAPFEVTLSSGAVLRVPATFDADALWRLLGVMVRAGAC